MNKLWRVAVVASIYIGTVIGAGFASGQEIRHFFSRFGRSGTYGLICSTVLLVYLGAKVMEWGRRIKAESYREFLHDLAGQWLGHAGDLLMTVFLFFLSGIMLAGAGAIAVQAGGKWAWGCWGTVFLAGVVLRRRLEGIKGVNLLVIPLLFITGIALNLSESPVSAPPVPPVFAVSGLWFLAALQFSAYNLFLALPVLVTLHQLEREETVLKWGGVVGGLALGILALLFHQVMLQRDASGSELPLLALTMNWGRGWRIGYTIVLWGELFTTLIAHTYGLATRLGFINHRWFSGQIFLLLSISVMIGWFGFARLIATLYPVFGVVSLLILLPLGIRPLPSGEKEKKTNRKSYIFQV